jgi:glycosyltransferase involved in cell wall biosynthesis
MKIIHIGWYRSDPVGGVGKTILEQTRALAEAGADIEIWHIGADCTVPQAEDVGEKYPVWKLPAETGSIERFLRLSDVTELWIRARGNEIAVIHLHSVFTIYNCHVASLARKLGIPYVITPNGGWNDVVLQGHRKMVKMLWIYLYERRMWNKAAFIQGVSLEEIRQLRSRPGMADLRHIPNGTSIPKSCSDHSERNCILYVGRYDIRQKGLDVMFEAIKLLVESGVKLPKIVLAGPEYRDGRKILQKYLDDNQLTEFVELRGPVQGEEKEALFRKAMIFIHTSRWEGLPLVLLEALSYGVPCLLTPGTNMASEWQAAGCAFEVPFDKEGIAAGIEQVITIDLSEFGSAARRLATTQYSWQWIALQLLETYHDAIDDNNISINRDMSANAI